jgi:hypothetical protein
MNRVVFDPDQVTVQQMEEWLIKSGTYIKTLAPIRQEKEKPQ